MQKELFETQKREEVPYANVVNDTANLDGPVTYTAPKEPRVVDAFSISKELKEALTEYFSNLPLPSLSEGEHIMDLFKGVKGALPTKVTITEQ